MNKRGVSINVYIIIIFCGLFSYINAQASQFDPKPLDQMVSASQTIVHGVVVGGAAERDAKGRIWTVYTLEVREQLKGVEGNPAPARITLRQLGGTLGKVTCRAGGVAHFAPGEEVLIFARDFGGGFQSAFSGPQGALRIEREDATAPSAKTSGAAAKPALAKVKFAAEPEELESFKARLRDLVRAQRAAAADSTEKK